MKRTDRGAVALIVAVVVPILLLGLGAIVIDVGSWYASRAQDQNGADAAVIAVARSCQPGPCNPASAANYVQSGGNGGLSQQYAVCGSLPGLAACSATRVPGTATTIPEDGKACPVAPAAGTKYVDVMTTPKNSNGTPSLTSFFGKGNQSVAACSQAQVGQYRGGTGLAVTMSICAWTAATGGGASPVYATPAPPYRQNPWPPGYTGSVGKTGAVPNPGGENVVQLTGQAKPCASGPSGLNEPGGFGWLSDSPNGQTPANCQVQTDANGYVYSSTGGINGQNGICGTQLQNIYNSSTGTQVIPNASNPIFVPVFDLACGSDGKLQPDDTQPCPAGMPSSSYHIAGYATFVLTGYDYNPLHADSLITGQRPCSGGNISCLYGLFTKGLVQSTGQICTSNCGTDFGGPVVIKLTG